MNIAKLEFENNENKRKALFRKIKQAYKEIGWPTRGREEEWDRKLNKSITPLVEEMKNLYKETK